MFEVTVFGFPCCFFWVGNINSEFGLHPTKKKQEGNPKTGTSPDLGPPQKKQEGNPKTGTPPDLGPPKKNREGNHQT